ncbi:MAG: PE domain-containing protein [Haloechinothrix sp.]
MGDAAGDTPATPGGDLASTLHGDDPGSGSNTGMRGLMGLQHYEQQARAAGVEDIAFDRDGVDQVINRVKALIVDKLEPAAEEAYQLHSVTPPGQEYASAGFANRANAAGLSYQNYLDATIEGLHDYVQLLERIRDNYVEQDDETAARFNRQDT